MTIHFRGLALASLALIPAASCWAQDAPSCKDSRRAARVMAQSTAAYKKLRSYSGRFQRTNRYQPTSPVEVQSGEIRWALPNRLWVRMETKTQGGTYSRRAVCDGRFLWISDSSLGGNFSKQPIGSATGVSDIAAMILAVDNRWTMEMPWIMDGLDPLQSPAAVRITSSPKSPTPNLTLAMEVRHRVSSEEGGETGMKTGMKTTLSDPVKLTLRFGADKLLREMASQQPAPDNTRATEKHWDIRVNPKLTASTFQFKPSPGARQVESLEVPR